MADRKIHDSLGLMAGIAVAYICSSDRSVEHSLLEVVGGGMGGIIGSRLPDCLDPLTHPRHRSFAHGVLPAAATGCYCGARIAEMQQYFRDCAERHRHASAQSTDLLEKAIHTALDMLFQIMAGVALGLLAGYASHLIADALTPMGLPILG